MVIEERVKLGLQLWSLNQKRALLRRGQAAAFREEKLGKEP